MHLFIFGCAVFVAVQTFSSCGEWGLLSSRGAWASHCSGFSRCRAWTLGTCASVVAALGLLSTGSVVVAQRPSCSKQVGSSGTRDQIRVPFTVRQILNH